MLYSTVVKKLVCVSVPGGNDVVCVMVDADRVCVSVPGASEVVAWGNEVVSVILYVVITVEASCVEITVLAGRVYV